MGCPVTVMDQPQQRSPTWEVIHMPPDRRLVEANPVDWGCRKLAWFQLEVMRYPEREKQPSKSANQAGSC